MSRSNLCPFSRKICGGLTEFGPGMDRHWTYCVHGQRLDKDWTKTGQRLDFVSMSRQPRVRSTEKTCIIILLGNTHRSSSQGNIYQYHNHRHLRINTASHQRRQSRGNSTWLLLLLLGRNPQRPHRRPT